MYGQVKDSKVGPFFVNRVEWQAPIIQDFVTEQHRSRVLSILLPLLIFLLITPPLVVSLEGMVDDMVEIYDAYKNASTNSVKTENDDLATRSLASFSPFTQREEENEAMLWVYADEMDHHEPAYKRAIIEYDTGATLDGMPVYSFVARYCIFLIIPLIFANSIYQHWIHLILAVGLSIAFVGILGGELEFSAGSNEAVFDTAMYICILLGAILMAYLFLYLTVQALIFDCAIPLFRRFRDRNRKTKLGDSYYVKMVDDDDGEEEELRKRWRTKWKKEEEEPMPNGMFGWLWKRVGWRAPPENSFFDIVLDILSNFFPSSTSFAERRMEDHKNLVRRLLKPQLPLEERIEHRNVLNFWIVEGKQKTKEEDDAPSSSVASSSSSRFEYSEYEPTEDDYSLDQGSYATIVDGMLTQEEDEEDEQYIPYEEMSGYASDGDMQDLPVKQRIIRSFSRIWFLMRTRVTTAVRTATNNITNLCSSKRALTPEQRHAKYYEKWRDFRYPARFLLAATASMWATTVMFLLAMRMFMMIKGWIHHELVSKIINISFPCVALLIYFYLVLTWILIFVNWKRKLMRMRQGKYDFDPKGLWISNARAYVGLQLTHTMVAVILLIIIALILLAIILTCVFVEFVRNLFKQLFNYVLKTLLVTWIVTYGLNYFVCFLFTKHGGRYLDNRRWFSIMDWISLWLYSVSGFMSCIRRLLFVPLRIFVTFHRLDMSVFPRHMEMGDFGYTSYCAMLLLEHTYNNPIASVFMNTLFETLKANKRQRKRILASRIVGNSERQRTDLEAPLLSENNGLEGSSSSAGISANPEQDVALWEAKRIRRNRVINRFRLWVTLINNPQLRSMRYRPGNADDGAGGTAVQSVIPMPWNTVAWKRNVFHGVKHRKKQVVKAAQKLATKRTPTQMEEENEERED
ncbi:hypothetical protein QOT17_025034 [Balamuthia mandrillaris]